MNKLTLSPYVQSLMNIENSELSNLQPRIRLFKVVYDKNGNEQEIELSFESHFSKTEMDFFKTRKARGAGVGLKNFLLTVLYDTKTFHTQTIR